MVRVPGWREDVAGEPTTFRDFFLGRYEVTNREFKAFVDGGGYSRRELWEHPFSLNGKDISWERAMARFVDQTGRPGPSTWEAGNYPEGEDDFPVGGVSWYEAIAYARSVGRELPSIYQWRWAAGEGFAAWWLPKSNLAHARPARVGSFSGMTWAGIYDMAGNVREWVFNSAEGGRLIPGGGWNDPLFLGTTMAAQTSAQPPMDRAPTNGFRVAIVRDEPDVAARGRGPLPGRFMPDTTKLIPTTDEAFAAYRNLYAYNAAPLNASIEDSRRSRHWIREHITFDASYAGERMGLYLFLPTAASPPYQTVLYWPGSAALFVASIDDYTVYLDYLLKDGRAVAFPVFKGTFERGDGSLGRAGPTVVTSAQRDLSIQWVKEARRTIDYLDTRPDLDRGKLAFYGHSWGGFHSPFFLSMEPRIKVAVLDQAGLAPADWSKFPEANPTNFVARVHLPVLLLSGEYDPTFPLEPLAKPFFRLLGTREADKKHVVAPGGHFVPRATLIRETLGWLDKYLGPTRQN
jgi:dienelactone hydrolase